MTIAIVVHGGAKSISTNKIAANRSGCQAAVEAGWAILNKGGSAAEAVEAAIRVLEADQTFNAGFGATLNSEGEIELDAAMIEGASLSWGAVAAVQKVQHPISAARKIMETKPMLLVAQSGDRFAAEHGIEIVAEESLISQEQKQEWQEKAEVLDRPNTVGCVALDANGTLVAGTSTGGVTNQPQGRVGDSAVIGCGLYADNQLGACSTTGDGESIIPVVLAKTAIDFLDRDTHPEAAAQMAINNLIKRVSGEAGCIILDDRGRVGWAHNSPDMAVAYKTDEMDEIAVFTKKEPETLTVESLQAV